jgi:hypothetical protein
MAIKKGQRLILKERGRETTVEAASDEHDGMVQVTHKGTTYSVSIYDVRPAEDDAGKLKGG